MENKHSNVEDLKRKSPFQVPEGYFEGLTDHIMSQLPEKSEKARKLSLSTRIRPWFYAAAIFAGACFFFKAYIGFDSSGSGNNTPGIWEDDFFNIDLSANVVDEDLFEYIESQYSNYILEAEFENFE
jgi:hypothetical protein